MKEERSEELVTTKSRAMKDVGHWKSFCKLVTAEMILLANFCPTVVATVTLHETVHSYVLVKTYL